MANIIYTATLDGASNFDLPDGSTLSWNGGGIFNVPFHLQSNDFLDASLDFVGSDWNVTHMSFGAGGGNITRISDAGAMSGIQIGALLVGDDSVLDLQNTYVEWLDGGRGGLHDVKLGSGANFVGLWADENKVTINDNFVRTIVTGGRDTIIVRGGAETIETRDMRDVVRVFEGYVQTIDAGDGADRVILNGGYVEQVGLGRGRDRIEVRGDSYAKHVDGDGSQIVTVSEGGRIANLEIYVGTQAINVTDNGGINSALIWRSDANISIGADAYVGVLEIYSDQAQSHVIEAQGWIGSLDVGGSQSSTIDLGNSGAGVLRLGDGRNVVTTGDGWVEFIATRDGNDSLVIGSGGFGFMHTGRGRDNVVVRHGGEAIETFSGADTVRIVNGSTVDLIDVGDGADTVRVVKGAIGFVRLGRGNDTLIVGDGSIAQNVDGSVEDKTILLGNNAFIGSLDLSQGSHTLTISGDSYINLFKTWRSDTMITVEDGGINSIQLYSDQAQTHKIVSYGWLGSVDISDRQRTTISLNDGGGSIQLGDLADRVKVVGGHVDLISASGGNDRVVFSDGRAGRVNLGNGDDLVILSEANPGGTDVFGSAGSDTVSFERYSGGVTVALDSAGIYQNVRAPDGDLTAPAPAGYFRETSVENIVGTGFADDLRGDFDVNQLNGARGNDTLSGLEGDDILIGAGGRDLINGGEGSDRLIGGAGNDWLRGAQAADRLLGGDGRDRIEGGGGDDVLTGNALADVFQFRRNTGDDRITDFAAGVDTIQFFAQSGGLGSLGFDDDGGDLRITHDHGTILLEGLAGTSLGADDFVF